MAKATRQESFIPDDHGKKLADLIDELKTIVDDPERENQLREMVKEEIKAGMPPGTRVMWFRYGRGWRFQVFLPGKEE